jgi:5-methylcytosine-specific restriction endonuclease McrA
VFPTVATEVDHIIPRSVRPDLIYELSNLQSACKACNSAKRDRENGSKVNENRAIPDGMDQSGAVLQTSAIAGIAA